ncbi:MAG TPA: sulfate ABC transporter ATP-binding protein [Bryobacteraceae bacterium]|jgi:sulfate transport system ATP-binding protein|nr:sulfate ABC transporter ATP-binding protein [Bryobacteraceae bacterium]
MSIEVRNIGKRFGAYEALQDVSLRIETGELVSLLGPSGSGKTTLLRIIAGLEMPDSGTIRLNEEDATRYTARDRQVGFVFQHYALFRHLTVFENIAFGLRLRPKATRPTEKDIRDRVRRLLDLVQLDWLGDRYPNQLSGGQRQRVALARALAAEPRVLLLDEPFGALDAKVRKELRRWLRRLHDDLHVASVFVTHDQEEALEVSDRVAIMNRGRIEQAGTPTEVYDNPATPFVYEFLGAVNLFHGRLDAGEASVGYVRPFELDVFPYSEEHAGASVAAIVQFIAAAGPSVRLELQREDTGNNLEAEISRERLRELGLAPGDRVGVAARNLHIFEKTAS